MHLRRALMLFAIVLGLTAIAAAVSPEPSDDGSGTGTGPTPAPVAAPPPRTVAFEAKRVGEPAERTARARDRLVITVSSHEGGQVAIPELGRTTSVTPNDPARFDLLAPAAGRYDLLFTATRAPEPRRVGTLVTRP